MNKSETLDCTDLMQSWIWIENVASYDIMCKQEV